MLSAWYYHMGMVRTNPTDRFLDSTRGKIVDLLRRQSRTVDELAAELGVTDNAVRLHLGMLERDGIVRSRGVRREGAVGKPATIYDIDPAAEPMFSKAYLPFLSALLAALGEKLSVREHRAVMRDVGRRLAAGGGAGAAALDERAALASRVLNELGGLTSVERGPTGKTMVVRGCGCPLSAAVSEREEVCTAVTTMLSEITGTEVRESCDRSGERPCCCFELS
jgi:predicted ArsR family transcriptional regulator